MGALIIAEDCHMHCQECFNQHLRQTEVFIELSTDIIDKVCGNVFNEGIILGGLEWSEQPGHAVSIIVNARLRGLQVILYTGLTEEALYKRIPRSLLKGCYVKFGKYDASKASNTYTSYGVKLASTNQYIKYIEEDN